MVQELSLKISRTLEAIRDRIKRYICKLSPDDEIKIMECQRSHPNWHIHWIIDKEKGTREIHSISEKPPGLQTQLMLGEHVNHSPKRHKSPIRPPVYKKKGPKSAAGTSKKGSVDKSKMSDAGGILRKRSKESFKADSEMSIHKRLKDGPKGGRKLESGKTDSNILRQKMDIFKEALENSNDLEYNATIMGQLIK